MFHLNSAFLSFKVVFLSERGSNQNDIAVDNVHVSLGACYGERNMMKFRGCC